MPTLHEQISGLSDADAVRILLAMTNHHLDDDRLVTDATPEVRQALGTIVVPPMQTQERI